MEYCLRRLAILLCLFLGCTEIKSQDTVRLDGIQKFIPLAKSLQIAIAFKKVNISTEFSSLNFHASPPNENLIPKRYWGQPYFRIYLSNASNYSQKILFFPGRGIDCRYYLWDGPLNKFIDRTNEREIESKMMLNPIPFHEFDIPANSVQTILIEPEIHYYNWNYFGPSLVKQDFVEEFAFDSLLRPKRFQIYFTTLMLGIMLSMCMFVLIRYFRQKRREYLYYGIASILFMLYFGLDSFSVIKFKSNFYSPLPYVFQFLEMTGFIFNILFVSRFLNLKEHLPDLFKLFRVMVYILVLFLLLDIPLAFSDRLFYVSLDALDGIRIFLMCCVLFSVVTLYTKDFPNRTVWYIATGTTWLLVLGAISLYFTRLPPYGYKLFGLKDAENLLFMVGLILELLFFMLGILNKEKIEEAAQAKSYEKLRLEGERNEMEKLKAVLEAREAERTRISQEMHDDIGAGLTSIRLLSEISGSGETDIRSENAKKISAIASNLVDRMNEIIWTLNPRNDTLGNLLAYLRHWIIEFLEPFDFQVRFSIPEEIPEIEINGSTRRNILLTVKEAIHNVAKHSGADLVEVEFIAENQLEILIRDNGSGFDVNHLKFNRNGIRNMHERIRHIGGRLSIENGNGTSVIVQVPIS